MRNPSRSVARSQPNRYPFLMGSRIKIIDRNSKYYGRIGTVEALPRPGRFYWVTLDNTSDVGPPPPSGMISVFAHDLQHFLLS